MPRVKGLAIFWMLMILPLLGLASHAGAEVVVFADPALESVIRVQIGIPDGDIHDTALAAMEVL